MHLNSWLTSLFRNLATSTKCNGNRLRAPWSDASAIVETLEPRQLLSAVATAQIQPAGTPQMLPDGPAVQVNTFTTGDQFVPSIATDAAGDTVVVWQSSLEQESGLIGIYTQRYNAQGAAVGGEIHVNTNTAYPESSPSVAMDNSGDFVVTWTSYRQDGSRQGIYAQRFDANGNPEGIEFRVNTSTLFSQSGASVAMDGAGDFVISWQSYTQQSGHSQIYAQRYSSTGAAVGGEFQVNADTTQDHYAGNVAMDFNGDFLITWQDATTQGSFGQRFSSNGTLLGSVIKFSSGIGDSSIAMDPAGDFVVTFSGNDGSNQGVFAQRYNANGIAQGTAFQVNSYTTGSQFLSRVAIDEDGGFVIVWQNGNSLFPAEGVHGQRYSPQGTPLGGEFEVGQGNNGQFLLLPDVAMDGSGNFTVVWQSSNGGRGLDYGVYAQRYRADYAPALATIESSTLIDNGTTPIAITSTLIAYDVDNATWPSATVTISSNYQIGQDQLVFANTPNITGSWNASTGVLTLSGIDSVANYQAALRSVQFETTGVNTSARTISFQANDGQQGSNIVSRIVDLPPKITAINNVTASPSSSSTAQFRVIFSEPVGGVTANDFALVESGLVGGTVALAGVDSVYTLTISGLEGHGTLGVNLTNFGSIIDARHNPVMQGFDGSIITVQVPGPAVVGVFAGSSPSQLPNASELSASVTYFTVAFSENVNSTSGGINSVTNPQNWQLTRYGVDVSNLISGITYGYDSTKHQYTAIVHFQQLLSEGGYQLVARQTIHDLANSPLNSNAQGVGGSNFNFNFVIASTVPSGPETRVNTVVGGNQVQPAIASDAKGDYVVVWSSYDEDRSSYGVYAQRYNAAGAAVGGEFRVNTYTIGAQEAPAVAMDASGDFVITWESFGQDGSSFGIYAQRYNANGVAQGGEFPVNTSTAYSQQNPTIAMDAAGDFVIAWWDRNPSANVYGDYAQLYNTAGNAVGTNFKVNTAFTGVNDRGTTPHAAMDSTGAFVIGWSDHVQRYNALGVAQGGAINLAGTVSSIAMDAYGDFVLTGVSTLYQNGSSEIFAQRYDSTGTSEGSFMVTTFTTYNQTLPSVAMDATGDFVVTWHNYGSVSNHIGFYARRFGSDGTAQGPEFRVDSSSVLSFGDPAAVAMDAAGDFAIAWKSANQDGSGTGIYARRYQIDVAPLLSNIESSPLIATPTLAIPVTNSLVVTDLGNTTLTGATIQIASNYQIGTDVLGYLGSSTPRITASWNASTGTLTLSGNDTVADYMTALHNVTYRDVNSPLSLTPTRTINFQVTDGLETSNVATRNVTILPLPTLSVLNPVVVYSSKGVPVLVVPNLIATDPDSVNLVSATISFANWQRADRLSVTNLFGLRSSFSQNLTTHTATLIISGSSTVAAFQAMLRTIQYSDTSARPTTTPRIATISVTDGIFTSNPVNVFIEFQAAK